MAETPTTDAGNKGEKRKGKSDDVESNKDTPIVLGKAARSMERDFTVQVGDTSFLHYSLILVLNCEYFDRMFSHDMIEKNEKRVIFADLDPDDWREVYKFIDPETQVAEKLNNENVFRLLPLFHRLEMNARVEECDAFIAATVPPKKKTMTTTKSEMLKEFVIYKVLGFGTSKMELKQSKYYHDSYKQEMVKSQEHLKHCITMLQLGELYGLTKTVSAFLSSMLKEIELFPNEWTDTESKMVKSVMEKHWSPFCSASILPLPWAEKSTDEQKILMDSPIFLEMMNSRVNTFVLKRLVTGVVSKTVAVS